MVNPDTGSKIKVPSSTLVDKDIAKIKAPETTAIFTMDVKTGAILY
ncbi:hypothetical protein N473_13190 [Pseudoalteromonas luteoviolacea CPMOR-1]|uniref:Uncharacterized protein n=1 Tax=Pseudoalteromonas luteoviolacea CPMOR-1 TaxID=1365248 RepID=A0A167LKQ5_9GAMM|nr:hypothetical protein N473_13190 [Pseudoalteromonas luteoviolacea CPMOR-1]